MMFSRAVASLQAGDGIQKTTQAEEVADPWMYRDTDRNGETSLFQELSEASSPGMDAAADRSWVGSGPNPRPDMDMEVGCEEIHLSVKERILAGRDYLRGMESSEEAEVDALEREKSDEEDVEVEEEIDMEMTEEELKPLQYITAANEKPENRVYRLGAWSEEESRILYDAKKREKQFLSGLNNKRLISADEKWKAIGEFCWSHGVQRSKEQCKFKWENSLPEYRRVKAFEMERSPNTKSYFAMERKEKRAWRLPRNLNRELFFLLSSVIEGSDPVVAASENKQHLLDGGEVEIGEVNGDGRKEGKCTALEKREQADGGAAIKGGKEREIGMRISKRLRKDEKSQMLPSRIKRWRKADTRFVDLNRNDGTPASISINEQARYGMEIVKMEQGKAWKCQVGNDSSPVHLNILKKEAVVADNPVFATDTTDHKNDKQREIDILSMLEDRKDSRHKEIIAVEREKLAVISSVASALNNVALAFQKVAEMFHNS